jgi:hypothetical protein
MRCGQCGRKLTDAALAMGYCPSCGNIFAPDATLMVTAERAPVVAQPAPVAGALPPSVVPREGASKLSRPLPSQAALPRVSQPIAAQPPAVSPVAATPAQSGIQQNIIFRAAIAALAVLALIGIGVLIFTHQGQTATHSSPPTEVPATATIAPTQTAAPAPTAVAAVPTPPAGFTTFFSPDHSFGMNYESSWIEKGPTTQTGSTAFTFTAPNRESVQITVSATTIEPASIVSYIQNFVASSNSTNFQQSGGTTDVTKGANTWTSAQGSFTDATGAPRMIIGLALNHNQQGYIFIYDAPGSVYTILPGSAFAEMVDSLTFLR